MYDACCTVTVMKGNSNSSALLILGWQTASLEEEAVRRLVWLFQVSAATGSRLAFQSQTFGFRVAEEGSQELQPLSGVVVI